MEYHITLNRQILITNQTTGMEIACPAMAFLYNYDK